MTVDELAGDPHPHLARLRAVSPVAAVPALGGFLVTGRDAAVTVLRDPLTFTVDDPRFTTARVIGPSMLSVDGDDHTRHRDPFAPAFRPRRVSERFAPAVTDAVTRRVGAIVAGPRQAELRSALAGPVAASVVATTLGLDGTDDAIIARLLGWYRAIVDSVSAAGAGGSVTVAGAEAMAALSRSLRRQLATAAPSLLHDAAETATLTTDEIVSNAAVIMFGGIETTEAMILNAVWFTLRSGWRPVEPGPAGVADAVEESLRLEPAAAEVDRYATAETMLEGVRIPEGAFVAVSLAAANRDPSEFPEPDRFDPGRPNLRRQLAFATGPHVCLGMDLARLETCVALSALLESLPGLRLEPQSPPPTGLVFRKPAHLNVTW